MSAAKQQMYDMRDMYERGYTIEEVGKEFGLSYTATRSRLVKAGTTFRKNTTRSEESLLADKAILAMRAAGGTVRQMAAVLKVTNPTVQRRINRLKAQGVIQ